MRCKSDVTVWRWLVLLKAAIAPSHHGLFVFGIIAFGMMFWKQIGLQHGAEMAARCASINSTLCPTSNPSTITNFAMQQALSLSSPASTFTYSTPACGNEVSASYTLLFPDILNLSPLTLTAQACFPA